jgi:hypothetical protein
MTAPVASGWSGRRWASHPLESAAFSRRTREADVAARDKSHRNATKNHGLQLNVVILGLGGFRP